MNETMKETHSEQIECPAHGDHEATLYQHGSKYAGVWECNVTGESDVCEHESTHVQESVIDYHDPENAYGHGQYEINVDVCDACKCAVENEQL